MKPASDALMTSSLRAAFVSVPLRFHVPTNPLGDGAGVEAGVATAGAGCAGTVVLGVAFDWMAALVSGPGLKRK